MDRLCNVQISYEQVSNAHVRQLAVSLYGEQLSMRTATIAPEGVCDGEVTIFRCLVFFR